MDHSPEYPPDLARSRELFQELKELDRKFPADEYPETFHPRKYEIIHDLAEARFFEAKEYFIQGLDSADADYRWECISALVTHWEIDEPLVVSKLVDKAKNDPDEQVRLIAIDSLGNLQISNVLSLLKQIALDEEEATDIRKTAYRAIIKILGHDHSRGVDSLTDEEFSVTEIDWGLLDDLG